MKKIQRFISALMIFVFLFAAYPLAQAADFSSWAKKMPVTFSGYSKSSTLTNFPALIVLSTNISGFSYADFLDSSGGDLRFTDPTETNELNYEIEKWNTNGSSYVWVQVPALASTTTVVNAYWGKNGAGAPAYTTNGATWSEGYVAVWHCGESSSPVVDSRSAISASSSGSTTFGVAGAVGNGTELGTNGYLTVGSESSFDFESSNTFALSAWVKITGATADNMVFAKGMSATPWDGFGWHSSDSRSDRQRLYLNDDSSGNAARVGTVAALTTSL